MGLDNTTSAVLVVREYPAISMAARMLPRASPSRASRKSSCLGVRAFVITVYFSVTLHYDQKRFSKVAQTYSGIKYERKI